MNEIIYLETDEEITSLIDRLRAAEKDALSLVVPRGSTIAQSIVNLKLLKKSAEGMGKEVSLVTSDRIARNLASQIGLTVFSKVSEAESAKPAAKDSVPAEAVPANSEFKVNSYYRNKDKDEVEDLGPDKTEENKDKEDIKQELEEIKSKPSEEDREEPSRAEGFQKKSVEEIKHKPVQKASDSKPSVAEKKIHGHGSKKAIIIISSICVVLLLAVTYLFLPYAKISMQVKSEDFDLEKEVIIDRSATSIDKSALVMPAVTMIVEKEMAKTYPATGKKEIGEKAKGTIVVSNAWDNNSVTLAKGTKFSSGGKTFVSLAGVTVEGVKTVAGNNVPGTAEVSVEAEQSGESYNIAPSNFTISGIPLEKQQYIKGKSSAAMSGGTTKTLVFVSAEDIAKAKDEVEQDALAEARLELNTKAEQDKKIIFSDAVASEIVTSVSTKKTDDEAENFDYAVKAKITADSVVDSDLRGLMVELASSTLPPDKMLLNSEKSTVANEAVSVNKENGVIKVKSMFKGKIGQRIEPKAAQKLIKNKNISKTKSILENTYAATNVDVSIWPKFFKWTPLLGNRVKITFDYAE